MSITGLNKIVGWAAISDHYREGLMSGRRAELIRDLTVDLEPEEALAVLSIDADTVQQFAAAVQQIIARRKHAWVRESESVTSSFDAMWTLPVDSAYRH